MLAIWVLAVLAVASADVSHLGYQYKVPQTSYGVPSYQIGGNSGRYYSGFGNTGSGISYKNSDGHYLGSSFSKGDYITPSHISDAQISASTLNGGIASGFGSDLANGYVSGINTGYTNGYSSGLASGSGLTNGPYYQTVGGPSTVQPIYLGAANQYQTTQYQAGEKYQQFYQVHQSNEPAQVYKHFYVHSAPEEPELPKARTPIVLPPPQKHYKIIFVKTPNVDSHTSQIVPVQPQNEEKTIVYVLVKKPEEYNEVVVPKVEQKPPTKPEVYFIKYNNKDDSEAVINNIVHDYSKPGQSVSYTTGGSESSNTFSGLPSTLSSSSGYVQVPESPALSDYPSSSIPSVPSSGFSSGFSKYPNIPSGSSFDNSFTSVPSSLSSGSSFSSIPSSSLYNKFGSSSGSSDSGSSSSGLGSSFNFASSSGSSPSSQFGSSQSDSSVQAPIISSLGSSSFGVSSTESTDLGNDAGADASSIFGSSSSSSATSGAIQDDFNSATGNQGLPHETYGVPKFRIA